MQPMPPTTSDFSVTAMRALLAEQFPGLARAGIVPIAEGGDFQTVRVDEALIFRFPRDERTAARLRREIAVLPALRPALPLAIPAYSHIGAPSPRYPYPFAGYPLLPGVSGERVRPGPRSRGAVAQQLGAFLSALHCYPINQIDQIDQSGAPLPVRPLPDVAALLRRIAAHADLLREAIPSMLTPAMEPYLRGEVALPLPCPFPPVLCHTDLKGEHVLVSADGTQVLGILDWSDLARCDPAADFRGVWIWLGAAFVAAVLRPYTAPAAADPHLFERSAFYARCGALEQLALLFAGASDAPHDLLLRQLRYAFT